MIDPDDARLMDVQQGGRCFLCGEPLGYKAATFDHLIPRAFGGIDSAANVVLAHRRCNLRKADELPSTARVHAFIALRKGSRLGVWPPLLALAKAQPGEEWIVVARSIAALGGDGISSPVSVQAPRCERISATSQTPGPRSDEPFRG